MAGTAAPLTGSSLSSGTRGNAVLAICNEEFTAMHANSQHRCRTGLPGLQLRASKPSTVDLSLQSQIELLIPRLRRYARALVHDPVAADDLVQDCLARALGKIHLWHEGTDLRAWLFTILHNQYISRVRRATRERDNIELQNSDSDLGFFFYTITRPNQIYTVPAHDKLFHGKRA